MKRLIVLLGLLLFSLASTLPLWAHGLMEKPASRNQFCGVITKPDQAANGTGQYPVCADAFASDFSGGYSFMSVLTHDVGRTGVSPLPEHVCGFGSETFQGGPTPWDSPIDWPTNAMTSGRNEIVWQINWGPHFDDTEEFRYWITKPDFQFQVGVPLAWSDFESQEFCVLKYDDSNPTGNPDVVAEKAETRFRTFCDVPERTGRHVIYGEWGRNFFTFERFHGCIDAVFGDVSNPVDARIAVTPDVNEITGAGSLSLDAGASAGSGLSFQWSVTAADPALYSFSDATAAATTFSFADPSVASNVTLTLTATDGTNSDSAIVQLSHLPDTPVGFKLLGLVTEEPQALQAGDRVQVRVVDSAGQDSFFPATPLTLDAQNSAPDAWPAALAGAVNALGADVVIGLLNASGEVVPVQDAVSNYFYSRLGSDVVSAFLVVTPAGSSSSSCEFVVSNEWDSGFTATIRINNDGTSAIDGWQVSWEFTDGSAVDNLWNANLVTTGSSYSASNLDWNGVIQPGQSAEFGFVGSKGGSSVPIPQIVGAVCQ
ncbi:MAG: cellulose binding domain-containing protein [Acidobacteriota bacterium]